MTQPYGSDPYRRGSALSRGFLPLALITLGVVFLLGNLVPDSGRVGLIVLGLGAAFTIGRLTTGRYGYAVPAGVLMAIGTYISLEGVQGARGMASGGAFFVLLGLGFAAVYAIGLRPLAVWPLIPAAICIVLGLILLGVWSLGPLASLSWIAKYWPVALVLLGVWLLLRESLPVPVRRPIATLGGIALLAYGVVASAASVAAGGSLARPGLAPGFGASPFADSVPLDAPISAGQTFTVDNSSGHTTIHGGTGSIVHVVATRHFNAGGQELDVRLTPGGNGVTLESSNPHRGFPFGQASSVDYSVEIPAGVAVAAQSGSGQLEIDGVSGTVQAKGSSGPITLRDIAGVMRVSTSSGSISLESKFTDAAEISTSSGSVNLKLLPDSAIQLDVHTGSGSVEPQGGLQLSGGKTNRDTLTGVLGNPAPGATLSVRTSSGSVIVSQ